MVIANAMHPTDGAKLINAPPRPALKPILKSPNPKYQLTPSRPDSIFDSGGCVDRSEHQGAVGGVLAPERSDVVQDLLSDSSSMLEYVFKEEPTRGRVLSTLSANEYSHLRGVNKTLGKSLSPLSEMSYTAPDIKLNAVQRRLVYEHQIPENSNHRAVLNGMFASFGPLLDGDPDDRVLEFGMKSAISIPPDLDHEGRGAFDHSWAEVPALIDTLLVRCTPAARSFTVRRCYDVWKERRSSTKKIDYRSVVCDRVDLQKGSLSWLLRAAHTIFDPAHIGCAAEDTPKQLVIALFTRHLISAFKAEADTGLAADVPALEIKYAESLNRADAFLRVMNRSADRAEDVELEKSLRRNGAYCSFSSKYKKVR